MAINASKTSNYMKKLAQNRKAHFDYELIKEYEAGVVLRGFEVKSVKSGIASLKGAFVTAHNEELFLINALIPLYKYTKEIPGYDAYASRKLLLHKKEISYLMGKVKTEGLTLVPLSMYNKKGRVKVLFALAKGKKKYDKRQTMKKRESSRRIDRAMKQRR